MLMIGFFARVNSRELKLSTEVDSAAWHRPEEILALVSNRPGSTAHLLCQLFLDLKINN
jgi:NADH pyrophosphatase NudC (nudix superfamily)